MDNRKNLIFSRINSIFETTLVEKKKVVIIGLGTGGSLCAIELAKCAVGHFVLIDYDNLELHNISRHACGLSDLGRKKTEAVRDAIHNINPNAKVECYNVDIIKELTLLDEILKDTDLVLPCTDTERSKYIINQKLMNIWFTKRISIPAIYAGAYERAFGGDIMRVIPGQTPCYDCVIGAIQDMSFWETKPKSKVAYSELNNTEGFKAEPGLGIDVHFIVLIQAKLGLLMLLKGEDTTLQDIDYNFVLWGNRKEWIFNEPFKCVFATIEHRKNCSTCGTQAYDDLGLEMSMAKNKVKEIVDNLPKAFSIDDLKIIEEDNAPNTE